MVHLDDICWLRNAQCYLTDRYEVFRTSTMANVNEARVFSNEGHTITFEKMYDGDIRNPYWSVKEKLGITTKTSAMTLEGGYLYMDQLIEQGYLGYN